MKIYKRVYPDGRKSKDWYYTFYVKKKRIRSRGLSDKTETRELAEALKVKLLREDLGIEEPQKAEGSGVSFDELAERFIEYSHSNKRSWTRDETSFRALSKVFSGRMLNEIKPAMIEAYRDKRKAQVTGSSVNRELACLKTAYNKAVLWELTLDNPVKKVNFLPENPQRTRYLSKEEINKLIDASNGHLRPFIIFALNTGMRNSEILGLTWNRVNPEEAIAELVITKNKQVRQVHLTPDAIEALKEARTESEYCFTYGGQPIQRVTKAFNHALKKAGIKHCRIHDLRHTWASFFMMSGKATLYDLKECGGWKSYSMVQRYAHLDREHRARVMAASSPTAQANGQESDQ